MRHKIWFLVAATIVVLVAATSSASAHEGRLSAEAHFEQDSVVVSEAKALRMERRTEAATEADAARAAAASAGDPAELGEWGPVLEWPVVGIHMALLANGKVLAYDSVSDRLGEEVHDSTRATVWDPASGDHTSALLTGFNIFCSGLAHLMDGSLFTAGGNKSEDLDGIRNTYVFETSTNTWSRGPDMAEERWYPTVTPLRNGETLITDGIDNRVDAPEVRATDGSLRSLTGAAKNLVLYPWMDVAPDGRVFNSGPTRPMRSLDTSGSGSWSGQGERDTMNRNYGGHAMYDVGKILVAGGGPSTPSSLVIDINGAEPQVSPTESMAFGRRQHNLTVLADGSVLATGGNSSGEYHVDLDNGVYAAERWDPATGQWTTLAPMQVTRQYHSTALLLPDGRLLVAGGGICGVCNDVGYLARNAEVFSPPYLFEDDGSGELADRPVIAAAPDVVNYNQPFTISSPDAGTVGKVAMVSLGAVTHSVNMEQRYVPLGFSASGGSLVAQAPSGSNIAPPGVYMLFVIGTDGVPSVAKMVRIEAASSPGPEMPTITGTGPASPAKDLKPEVKGFGAPAGSTVRVYRDSSCSGTVVGTGTASAFNGTTGITATVPANQTSQLRVKATDAEGISSACSAPFAYTHDTIDPETTITDGPPATTTSRSVTFSFASSETGSGFRCKLDAEAFAPCSSPSERTVGVGSHTFRVKAIDAAGNLDETPAKRTFRVVN